MTEIHLPIGGEHATLIIVHNAKKFNWHLVKKCTLKRRINFCAIQINNVFAVCSFFFFELGENGRHNKTPSGLSWSTGERKFCFPITIDVSFAGLRLREPLGSQGNETYDFA